MKRLLVVWIASCLILVVAPASIGNAGVTPVEPNSKGPQSPTLILEFERYVPPGHAENVAPTAEARASGSAAAPPQIIQFCKVDPEAGTYGCPTERPTEEQDAEGEERELTEGDVLTAVREIGMPALQVRVEPGAETLVNIATNFYTEPAPFNRSIELLGFDVDIEATPASFTWTHGDGTSTTTRSPGRPYPHLDVTHRYRAPAAVVRPRVDVTYQVRYRVDGGAWAPLSQTLTATGPAGTLAVNEAAPVLTAP